MHYLFVVTCFVIFRTSNLDSKPIPVAAGLLRLWVRIPPVVYMSVCCEWCVFSGRGLWDELITRPGKSYRLWCVVVCFRNLVYEKALAHWGAVAPNKKNIDSDVKFR